MTALEQTGVASSPIGFLFAAYYWIRDKVSGTTTNLDGTVTDNTSGKVISMPASLVDQYGTDQESLQKAYEAYKASLDSNTKAKLNIRKIITWVVVLIVIWIVYRLLKAFGIVEFIKNKLIKKRR